MNTIKKPYSDIELQNHEATASDTSKVRYESDGVMGSDLGGSESANGFGAIYFGCDEVPCRPHYRRSVRVSPLGGGDAVLDVDSTDELPQPLHRRTGSKSPDAASQALSADFRRRVDEELSPQLAGISLGTTSRRAGAGPGEPKARYLLRPFSRSAWVARV